MGKRNISYFIDAVFGKRKTTKRIRKSNQKEIRHGTKRI